MNLKAEKILTPQLTESPPKYSTFKDHDYEYTNLNLDKQNSSNKKEKRMNSLKAG